MTLADALGWIATALGVILFMPQLIRLARTGNVEGLSLISWQAMVGLNLAWTAHGYAIGQLPQLLSNVLSLFATTPILLLLARALGRRPLPALVPSVALAGLMVASDAVFGSTAFGLVAIAPSIVVSVGQTVELIRAEHVRGVSPLFLSLGVVNLAIWVAWGVLVQDSGTQIAVSITLLVSVLNLVWYVLRRLGLRAYFSPVEAAPVPLATVAE